MKEGVEWTLNLKDLATGKLEKFNLKLQKSDQLVKGVKKNAESSGAGLIKFGAGAFVAAEALGAIRSAGSAVLSGMVEQVSAFEKYNAVLTNTFGSQKVAGNSMAMILDIAKTTPFSVNELTESYVKLAGRGIAPTRNEVFALGDFAAATGKKFDDLTEAVMDASNPERWKEFGVKSTRANGMVTLSFKDQTVTVKDNAKAVKEAIVQFGLMTGVQGGMAVQSVKLGGKISNLGDTWDQFNLGLGASNSGALVGTVDLMSDLIQKTGELLGIQPMNIRLLEDERKNLFMVRDALVDSNKPEKERLELMKKMIREYPEQLGFMKAEAGQMHTMVGTLDDIIERQTMKIALAKQDAKKQDQASRLAEAKGQLAEFSATAASKIPEFLSMNPEFRGVYEKKFANRPAMDFVKSLKYGVDPEIDNVLKQKGGNVNYGKAGIYKAGAADFFGSGQNIERTIRQTEANVRALEAEQRMAESEYLKMFGVKAGQDLKAPPIKPLGGGGSGTGDGKIEKSLSGTSPKIVNITMDAVMKGDMVFQNASDLPGIKQIVKQEISNTLAEAVADAKILGPKN